MEHRKKRLQLRAWRRGTRELDLIIGTVVDRMIETMSEADLLMMEELLHESDLELFDWIIGVQQVPAKYDNHILAELRDFAKMSKRLQQGQTG